MAAIRVDTRQSSFARFLGITISSDAASIAISNRDLGNGLHTGTVQPLFFFLPPKKVLDRLKHDVYTDASISAGAGLRCRVLSSSYLKFLWPCRVYLLALSWRR